MSKKIAHQPGYELRKDPKTGANRWHAVMKKRIDPESGNVIEEPALFEELPDPEPEEFWVARAYLKHRGIEFHEERGGTVMDLPDPEDIGEFDSRKFVDAFLHFASNGDIKIPQDFGEWVDEVGILDSDWKSMGVSDSTIEMLISTALERRDPGIGSFVVALLEDEDEVVNKLKEMFLERKIDFLEDYGDGVEALDVFLSAADQTFDGLDLSYEIGDELLNFPKSNIIPNDGYWDRVYEFKRTRNKAAEELVKVLGAKDFDEAVEMIRNDPNAIQKWGERILKEELNPDSPVVWSDELLSSYSDSLHDLLIEHEVLAESDHPIDRKRAQAFQDKYAEYIRGIHVNPALSINRLPGTVADMLQSRGEYMWRKARGPGDDRVRTEDLHRLGRVGYAALAYDNAAPVLRGASAMVQMDPNTLALGTGGWGDVRLLWTPPELVDPDGEGLSWSFDDSFQDAGFEEERPFWLSAALSGFSHSARNLFGYSDELVVPGERGLLPNFTEMHFRRPLKVDSDLSKIFIPVKARTYTADGEHETPSDIARTLVYNKFARENWGSTIAKYTPKGVDLFIQPQTLGEKLGKEYTQDVVGTIRELVKKEFGDRVKLWLPKSLKN